MEKIFHNALAIFLIVVVSTICYSIFGPKSAPTKPDVALRAAAQAAAEVATPLPPQPSPRAQQWREQNQRWASEKTQRFSDRRALLEADRSALNEELATVVAEDELLDAVGVGEPSEQGAVDLPPELSLLQYDGAAAVIKNIGARQIKIRVSRAEEPLPARTRRSCVLGLSNSSGQVRSIASLRPGASAGFRRSEKGCSPFQGQTIGVEILDADDAPQWMSAWLHKAKLADTQDRRDYLQHRLIQTANAISALGVDSLSADTLSAE